MSVEVHILKDRCKGCMICVGICQADVLRMSDDRNANGYPYPEVQSVETCVECGMCEMFCPDFAIWITLKTSEIST